MPPLKKLYLAQSEDEANISGVSPFIVRFAGSGFFSNTVQDNKYSNEDMVLALTDALTHIS